ncbi:MAG: hypothetical protein ACRDBO_00685 [Lachnospiraceae bacterium]
MKKLEEVLQLLANGLHNQISGGSMNADENRRGQLSIKTYILLVFIISIIATVVLKISQNARQRIEEGDKWLVSQLCETANYLSGRAENISATLAFDSDIQSALIAYQYRDEEQADLDQVRIWINSKHVDTVENASYQ